ncbi:hypothetical protein [Riemerella columbipharyngis]|uniref:Uncharacterized protein n=1 Tax=Riemerella columbipharyngis TaxID=1071918 RepID=A0A1G7FYP4_9FLAO|nr:hypothetical protein [Riemerella columbipharyngis]SDE80912.1 hypothetical protein SAMN05421544_1327 [Riemerella columbipharyngis]
MEKYIKSTKQAFEDSNVVITKVLQGYDRRVRIDAKTRSHQADMDNFFSEWVSERYANKLSIEIFGKKVNELRVYRC